MYIINTPTGWPVYKQYINNTVMCIYTYTVFPKWLLGLHIYT